VLNEELGNVENKNFQSLGVNNGNHLNFNCNFTLKNVSFCYDQNKKEILREVNLEVIKGECIGIVGESGAGKSTLSNLLLGLVSTTSGVLEVDGCRIQSENIQSWQQIIGYVPQEIYLLDDTIERNIAFGINDAYIEFSRVGEVVKKAGIQKYISSLDEGLNSKIGERGVRLSGGQRQRIGIARALYQNPQVLILDEATSALDAKTEEGILEELQLMKGNVTMIIIAHRSSTLQFCDRIYKIEDGCLELES
jgi:ABC-type bacteriocin/lantibiotic exporter with double-glycine peptidase domain